MIALNQLVFLSNKTNSVKHWLMNTTKGCLINLLFDREKIYTSTVQVISTQQHRWDLLRKNLNKEPFVPCPKAGI